jgi:hypothetical protein
MSKSSDPAGAGGVARKEPKGAYHVARTLTNQSGTITPAA